jgi:peroxiredoxin
MRCTERAAPIALILLFVCTTIGFSQHNNTETDSVFAEFMSNALSEIRTADSLARDSLKKIHSKKFYDYYRQHPKTETSRKALSEAFEMWGDIGEDQYIDEALETLDKDSGVWAKIIWPLYTIYHKSEKRDMKQFKELLVELKKELTDPVSKSEVLFTLIRREKIDENYDAIIPLAEKLIELDATPFYVKQGEGYLYEMTTLRVGQQAANFKAETIDGDSVSLNKMDGKFVLLDFWATWCPPCIPEIPNLKMLSEKYDKDEFEIISISLDQDKEALTEMIEEKGMKWKQVHQEKAWKGEIAKLYNVKELPRKYLINPEGKIVAKDIKGEKMIIQIEKQIGK